MFFKKVRRFSAWGFPEATMPQKKGGGSCFLNETIIQVFYVEKDSNDILRSGRRRDQET